MANFNTPGMGAYGSTWQQGGYSGAGNVGGLIGSLASRPAIVVGPGEGVFQELRDVLCKFEDPVIFAVNDVGIFLDRLDHWVSLHADHLQPWKDVRWLNHRAPEDVKIHSVDVKPGVDYVWQGLNPLFALSGYFAMQIAYVMGCEPIVLCGCPGSPGRRFFDTVPRDNFGYGGGETGSDRGIKQQLINEMNRVPEFKAKVRSMSGWTADYFGRL